ncbi:MAG: hypothetical protein ACQETX_16705 [Pseudomonadota bacterium]
MELPLFNTKTSARNAPQPDSLELNFDQVKVISHLVILTALVIFGIAAIVGPSGGNGEEQVSWLVALILISMPGYLIVKLILDQRLEKPILEMTQEGFRDRRLEDRDWVSWHEVEEASPKRQILMRGIKVVLSDGGRADIDMTFLQGTPLQVISFIQHAARKAEARRAETEGPAEGEDETEDK